jgi:hypothetical protein
MPPEVFAYEPMTGRAEWTQQPTHCRSGFCKALTEPWYRSPEYAFALEVRDTALSRNLILVDGVPL